MALGAAIATGGDSRQEVTRALSEPGFDTKGATSAVRFFPDGRSQPTFSASHRRSKKAAAAFLAQATITNRPSDQPGE